MKEEWRDVKGFEGLYQISNFGRVKSFKRSREGIILKLTNKKNDYLRFVFEGIGKKRKSTSIHRVVAETFIGNPNGFPVVNHIDGNKQNNRVDNLEWCTIKHNVEHALMMHPDSLSGMIHYNKFIKTKPVVQFDKNGAEIGRFISAADAARKTGICCRNINQVLRKDEFKRGHPRKTAGGFIWRFESEVIGNG